METGAARSPAGIFAGATAFLLPLAFSPLLSAATWTPKAAVCLVVAGVAAPLLARQALQRRAWAPRAGVAFLAVAAVSTLLSDQPAISTFGLYLSGTGLLFLVSVVGAWALGRSLTPSDRVLLERLLLAGSTVTITVGIAQMFLTIPELELLDGRSTGLVGNPTQFGALAAASLTLAAARLASSRRATSVLVVILLAAAVQTSGSRFALIAAIAVVGISALTARRTAVLLVFAFAVGLAIGALAIEARSQDQSSMARLGAGSGLEARVRTWVSASHAVADRPVLGSGPGRFRAATSRYRTLHIARVEGSERLFADAHNALVELMVTVGIVGTAMGAAWLVAAARQSQRSALLAFAAVSAGVALVEPLSLVITPLAALALGASSRDRPRAPAVIGGRRLPSVATAALTLASVLAATRLLVGDYQLRTAGLDFSRPAVDAAVRLLPPWSDPRKVKGRIEAFSSRPEALDNARHEFLQAARLDPTDPATWNRVGYVELRLDRRSDARGHFLLALRNNPWSVNAMEGLARVEEAEDDGAEARTWRARSDLVRPVPERDEGVGSRPPPRREDQNSGAD